MIIFCRVQGDPDHPMPIAANEKIADILVKELSSPDIFFVCE
jgi:hypothetical protein